MREDHFLNSITATIVIALHCALIVALWHTASPTPPISAPVMSFVDLNSLNLGNGAPSSHAKPADAPAPAHPRPQPKIKAVDKPAIKPVIKATSKPDLRQRAEDKTQVVKQPVVRESAEKVRTAANADRPSPHMAANGTGSAAGKSSGAAHETGGNEAGNSGSGAGGAATQPTYKAGYLNNPKPPYPAMSRENGEEGTVILSVTVEANGTASRVSVSRTSGYPRLDHSAQNAVAKYRFKPATRGGVPISYTYAVPINFSLR